MCNVSITPCRAFQRDKFEFVCRNKREKQGCIPDLKLIFCLKFELHLWAVSGQQSGEIAPNCQVKGRLFMRDLALPHTDWPPMTPDTVFTLQCDTCLLLELQSIEFQGSTEEHWVHSRKSLNFSVFGRYRHSYVPIMLQAIPTTEVFPFKGPYYFSDFRAFFFLRIQVVTISVQESAVHDTKLYVTLQYNPMRHNMIQNPDTSQYNLPGYETLLYDLIRNGPL